MPDLENASEPSTAEAVKAALALAADAAAWVYSNLLEGIFELWGS